MADDGDPIGGGPSPCFARGLRQRDQPHAVEDPPRDRQHAIVGQVIEIVVEGLDRVERVLGQGVAPAAVAAQVDERRLNHVVRAGVRRTAAAVLDENLHLRMRVDAARSPETARA